MKLKRSHKIIWKRKVINKKIKISNHFYISVKKVSNNKDKEEIKNNLIQSMKKTKFKRKLNTKKTSVIE